MRCVQQCPAPASHSQREPSLARVTPVRGELVEPRVTVVTTLPDLRHTHATVMLIQGIHPKVVQERLGHEKISTTLDVYSHVIKSMQTDAVQKFDEALAPRV